MNSQGPEKTSVTMYDVGFGDCFLVTFHYAREKKRRILIDCGSTSKKKEHMRRVVNKIVEDCQGHLDAIVATHRHKDHISAFGLTGLGEKLALLNPDVVIQPWTEHPDAEEGALKAPSVYNLAARKHMMGLEAAQEFALHLTENPTKMLAAAGPQVRRQLENIASLSIYNKKAILQLTSMGKKHAYVSAGSKTGLERKLPGVRVSVLGPPTLKQSTGIRKQKSWDDAEFWKLHARLAATNVANSPGTKGASSLFPNTKTRSAGRAPSYTKWLIRRLDTAQLHQAKRIVRDLDNALNNTSVVLLFEIGEKALLFPGDAQLENWQYALENQEIRDRLQKTILYKVGHHGSTNATPKSLWELFNNREQRENRLISLLSTEKGHHNKVPRESLVHALKNETVLHTTTSWRNKLSETYFI